jgi:hypothetical protein
MPGGRKNKVQTGKSDHAGFPGGQIAVTVRLGAWKCRGIYRIAQLDAVLADVERAVPGWCLARRRTDPTAHLLLRRLLFGMCRAPSTTKLLEGTVKAATWLAVNDPAGNYRTALAEAVRKHGHACLSVTASTDGLVWDMAVSSMEADLAPALVQVATDLSAPPSGVSLH